jgi:hypothetical protein
MIEQIARYPRVRDRAIFVGDPGDPARQPPLATLRAATGSRLRGRR